ncbi:hypothetical protein [Salinigranum sp. GCM10025319]|uniref:hypothetical protein n=1 Tax=Salinigranum sp. GCM10025319 TaxID=3252687 RepID=UPI00361EA92F
MGERHVVVRTTGGTWHRVSCLWVHVGVRRCRERVISDAELARLDPVCNHCLGDA